MMYRLLWVLLLFVPGRAWATTYYVDGSCTTGGTGTNSTCEDAAGPFKTIAAAIAAVNAAGDGAHTINIAGGQTYTEENLTLTVSGTSTSDMIVIQPEAGTGNVVVDGGVAGDGNYNGFNVSGESFIKFTKTGAQTFTIQNMERCAIRGVNNSGAVKESIYIDGLIFTGNNSDSNDSTSAVYLEYVDYGRIENINITTHNDIGVLIRYCDGSAGVPWLIDSITIGDIAPISTCDAVRLIVSTYVTISNSTFNLDLTALDDLNAIYTEDSSHITVSGNTIAYDEIVYGDNSVGIQLSDTNSSTITGNTISQAGEDGIEVDLQNTDGSSYDVLVEKNTITNCAQSGIAIADWVGYNGVDWSQPIIVKNNVIVITDEAVTANGMCFDIHGAVAERSAIYYYNNTCYATAADTVAFDIGTDDRDGDELQDVRIQNNILWVNNEYAIRVWGLLNLAALANKVSHNHYYRASGTALWYVLGRSGGDVNLTYTAAQVAAGDLFTDYDIEPAANYVGTQPVFVSAPSNLRLLVSDSGIDVGATIAAVTDDRVGTARPQGAAYDIGAYEYLVSTPGSATLGAGGSMGLGSGGSMTLQ